ncbi:hypothetical protein STEG23_032185 [Scotinomys teguina]
METGESLELPDQFPKQETTNKRIVIKKPQPVRLIGVDSVFGGDVTVQPPKWTGTFRVSDTSAFTKVISKKQECLVRLKESQIEMALAICKQMLRSIFLLYATYKKCTFALEHSQ